MTQLTISELIREAAIDRMSFEQAGLRHCAFLDSCGFHRVQATIPICHDDCIEWCNAQFGLMHYLVNGTLYWFDNPEKAAMFKLRWG
jgi:hypothetical protein